MAQVWDIMGSPNLLHSHLTSHSCRTFFESREGAITLPGGEKRLYAIDLSDGQVEDVVSPATMNT